MASNIHLLDLIRREKLDKILRGFTEVAGVASIISDANGRPITEPHNFTEFCFKYCRSTEEGKRRCHISDCYGGTESLRTGTPPIYNCLNGGLMDCAAPIIVEGSHLATVLCGQVLDEPLTADFGQKRAHEIGVTDIDGYLQALATVPLMTRRRLLNIANLMAVITQTISELALQKYLQHKHSQHYLNRLINSVSDCIVSTNMDGIISIINEAGADMFGYDSEDLIGKSISTLFSDEASQRSYWGQLQMKHTADRRIELNAVKANRQSFPVQVSIAGINKEKSKDPDYVTVIRDISEQRKTERMKEDLIGMVAHDIKNPVLSMQKALQLLINEEVGPLNEVQTEVMHLTLETSHQLYGMVCNLLDIYRRENGQFLLDKTKIEISQVINESSNHVKLLAQEKRVTIEVHPAYDPILIMADWDRLQRTCINLLENAVNYSPEDGKVSISCRLIPSGEKECLIEAAKIVFPSSFEAADSYVLVTVSDQGPGIPPAYQEAVFEKFFTISRNDRGRKSLGLGLTFCRQVIETHGGAIWVKSPVSLDEEKGKRGCQFQFMLPAA
ncbi:MAG: PocR ligand-binding domain-containing protein [Desulfoferrobacter sp.]